jgi:hypothetical protein
MLARRSPLLVALLLVAAGLIAPAPTDARPYAAQLRGGLSAIAGGAPIPGRIERRVAATGTEIAVSLQLQTIPDSTVLAALRRAGLAIRGSWGTTLDGYVSPTRLAALATVPVVRSMMPIRNARIDAFVGPAPALHGATAWQQAGYLGGGVKIGILDGGFDGLSGFLGTELPATVQARCYTRIGIASTDLSDCVTPGERHGTAVAESIVDMAPGASLYVSNARSPADMAATIAWMTAAGVKVINFSQASSVLLEGMGDGTSAYPDSTYRLVDQAIAGGALFVAAAGNSGETSWMGAPTDTDADGWIEFAAGDEANAIDLEADQEIAVAVRWADAASDYDVSIRQGDVQLAVAADDQSATGDPLELLDFSAPSAGRYEISIRHDRGPTPPTMRMLVWTPGDSRLTYRTTAGSLAAPADSHNPGLVTVGAVDYASPTIAEPYSSRGPTLDGRIKPDLVAADCGPTVTYAVFCGTSQSAPIVSGAAALVLQAKPDLMPSQLAEFLRSHATPIGSPVPNNDTGYGSLALGAPPNVPASLAFLAPAASGTEGAPFLGQPVVGILDATGTRITTGPGASLPVTLAIATNPSGGTLTCPAGLTTTAVAGVAAFTGCGIEKAGSGYTVQAQATGVSPVTGAPFTIAAAGTPPALTLTGSAPALAYGKAITLTGQVALPGGAAIAIDAIRLAGGTETDVRPATTDAAGTATWSFKPIVTSDYRIRTIAPGTGLVEVSAPIHVTVNATAVLGSSVASGRTISRSTSITVTTTIRPVGATVARGRARVDLYQRTSAGWTRRRTVYANADATGRARATIRLPSAGSWWIRSRAEPTATNAASTWTAGVKYSVR